MAAWPRDGSDLPGSSTQGLITPRLSGQESRSEGSPVGYSNFWVDSVNEDVPGAPASTWPDLLQPCRGIPRHALMAACIWITAALFVVGTCGGAGTSGNDRRGLLLKAASKQKPAGCHGQPAERLACEAGITVEQFCSKAWNSQMVGCSGRQVPSSVGPPISDSATARQVVAPPLPAPPLSTSRTTLTDTETSPTTSASTTTTSTTSTPTGTATNTSVTTSATTSSITTTATVDEDGCCIQQTAHCLACKSKLSLRDFCSAGSHKSVTGCGSVCLHAEENMGYRGGDLWSKKNVSSAQACCKLCRSVHKCTSWTWGKQGNLKSSSVCFLKDQSELMRVPNPNFVSGLPHSPTTSFKDKTGYHGGDLWSKKGVKRAEACCNLCRIVPKCASWTWGKNRHATSSEVCFLKQRSDLQRIPNPDFVSGLPHMPYVFEIKNRHGNCLSAMNGELSTAPCKAETDGSQGWMYDFWTGHIVAHLGTCLDAPEDFVRLKPCSKTSDTQKLVHFGGGNGLIYGRDGFCLRANSLTEPGSAVSMWTCNASALDQQWSMFSVWHLGGKAVKQAEKREMHATAAPVAAAATLNVLFCFTFALPKSEQEQILRQQLDRQAGIFACDTKAVYSTEAFSVGNLKATAVGVNMVQGGDLGMHSAPVYAAVWGEVMNGKMFRKHEWTVKVDPHTVFLPWRLRTVVNSFDDSLTQTERGVYLRNCDDHMSLPIEVVSRRAMQIYAEKCLGWHKGGKAREDEWLESVLLDLQIAPLPTTTLMPGLSCTATSEYVASTCGPGFVAFYPLMTAKAYGDCLSNATKR